MTAILLPCLIYSHPLFGGQVGPEDFNSFQVPVNICKLQEFAKVTTTPEITDVGIVSQKSDFREKSISKDSGGFVKFGNTVNFEGISIPNPSAKEYTNDSKPSSDKCYFIGTKVQFWTALVLGFIDGALIAIALLHVIFYLKFHT